MDDERPPLILEDRLPLQNGDAVRLLLQCVTTSESLDPTIGALIEPLLRLPGATNSPTDCVDALIDALPKWIAAAGDDDVPTLQRLLGNARCHREETLANQHAYTTHDKPHPDAVFWPGGNFACARRMPIIKPGTVLGSAGSCFAWEIAYRLQALGYNYLVTQPNRLPGYEYHYGCAKWGAIYNAPSFRQLIQWAFGQCTPPPLLCTWTDKQGRTVYHDPFRDSVLYETVEQYQRGRADLLGPAREALQRVEVFVITLGLNEVWTLKSNGLVFSRSPWRFSASFVRATTLTVDQNLEALQSMLNLWRQHNPGIKLIVTVSPVPLRATFQASQLHVAEATCEGKATLRLAVKAFAQQNKGVYYFPAFEQIMYCTPDPWQKDQRHVKPEAVEGVMRLFQQMFVAEPSAAQGRAVPAETRLAS